MDQQKGTPPANDQPSGEQTTPKDALSKTNEELGAEAAPKDPAAAGEAGGQAAPKKRGGIKGLLHKFNLYLALFLFLVAVAAAFAAYSYKSGKKPPATPSFSSQTLNQNTLSQLDNSNATVGDSGQTLTVQGNAIFSGQVLIRSNLDVAGTLQLGSTLTVPSLTVSGTTNLSDAQINSLKVADITTLQGNLVLQDGETVAGPSDFSGPITANQITVTKLIMSGNASLQIPNHIAFTGATPARNNINLSVLGVGGSSSLNGSDTTGTININTGNNPTAGCYMTLTFNVPFASTPHVLVSPVGAGAGQTEYYVNRTTTGFTICTDNAPPGNQTFAYDYFVTD